MYGTAKDEGKSMADDLQRISLWMECKKITVNEGKSKVLNFKPKLNFIINLKNIAIKLTNEMKNLWVTLENSLKNK